MAEAYKLKADASLPRAIREADELADGTKLYETVGANYVEGSYVLEEELNPRDRERASNGDLDHLLEPASKKDAEEYRHEAALEYGTFIPEHEAERVVLETYGHEVVPRDQVLELRDEATEGVAEAIKEQKADGADERPNLTAAEVPDLASVERRDEHAVVPKDAKPVEVPEEGLEQPPGIRVGGGKKRGRPKKSEEASKSEAKKSE